MKRLYLAIALCVGLLAVEAAVLLPKIEASPLRGKSAVRSVPVDPAELLKGLLGLPAPAPPNPYLSRDEYRSVDRGSGPPSDNAPIAELVEFWSQNYRAAGDEMNYWPRMSDKTFERLAAEVERDPSKLVGVINSFPSDERSAEFVKSIWDHQGSTGVFDRDARRAIRSWLLYNSPYFTSDLARMAQRADNTDTYVVGKSELLKLARWDFDKARPIIDRLYNAGSSKASRSLALWALYKDALRRDSLGDIERYRDELKKIVESRDLSGPMRDLAMDALVAEKEWPGRDEWYLSLLSDPTLLDLNGYSGLTTIIGTSPPGRFEEKMVDLISSSDPVVRAAAIRNLGVQRGKFDAKVLEALVPWLEDPNWAKDVGNTRASIIRQLSEVKVPASVPGLIKVLDEKSSTTNSIAAAAMAAAVAAVERAVAAANRTVSVPRTANVEVPVPISAPVETYAFRSFAISALAFQQDARAVPVLRRILGEVNEWERVTVISALRKCGGFTVAEQIDAIERALKESDIAVDGAAANTAASTAVNAVANISVSRLTQAVRVSNGVAAPMAAVDVYRSSSPDEIRVALGLELIADRNVSDDLARGVVDLITTIDDREPERAQKLRTVVLNWSGSAVHTLLLSDLKRGRAEVDAAVKLLGERRALRETLMDEIFDLRNGPPASVAFASCLLEDTADQRSILENGDDDTKAFLLACGRLVRAPLPVQLVAPLTVSPNKTLGAAAEAFLESEDSPEARAVVLGLHPGEAKILGAWSAFWTDPKEGSSSLQLATLLGSFDDEKGYFGWLGTPSTEILETEEKLRKEVLTDKTLLGIYAYDGHYVRIYQDRVIFSWDEDEARYRERALEPAEFDHLKAYISSNQMDNLPPFAQCGGEYCQSKELLMLGRNGGRRLYLSGSAPPVFAGLENLFEEFKRSPAVIKYALSREVPGLELIMTDENLAAAAVWKSGSELRAAVRDVVAVKKLQSDIEAAIDRDDDPITDIDQDEAENEWERNARIKKEITEKMAPDSLSWRSIINGSAAGAADQPPGFEFIPARDATSVPATSSQWLARVGSVEYRTGPDGLYKVSGGRAQIYKKGLFGLPLVTPNGRWLIVYRGFSEELSGDPGPIRIDLATGRILRIKTEDTNTPLRPTAYIPSINKVVVYQSWGFDAERDFDEADEPGLLRATEGEDPDSIFLIDPDTGVLSEGKGEFRPFVQQTYRPLQPASIPGTVWAAIIDEEKSETLVGTYDVRTFKFKLVRRVPKIKFNSMDMWADETENRLYFVYRGHVLRLPLRP